MNCLEGLTSLPPGLSISGGSGSVGGLSKGILDMKIGTFDSRAARAEGIATGAGIPGLAPDLVKSTSQLLQQQQAFFCASHQKSKAFLIHLVSILGAIDCFLCGFNHPYVATAILQCCTVTEIVGQNHCSLHWNTTVISEIVKRGLTSDSAE